MYIRRSRCRSQARLTRFGLKRRALLPARHRRDEDVHTPFTYCEKRLVSKSPDNYLLAHHLFKSAFEAGYKDARYLIAASIDRYLSFTEGRQLYGTNRLMNQETGKEEWVPIDRNVSDSERAKYAVLPLAELLKRYPEQKAREKF